MSGSFYYGSLWISSVCSLNCHLSVPSVSQSVSTSVNRSVGRDQRRVPSVQSVFVHERTFADLINI